MTILLNGKSVILPNGDSLNNIINRFSTKPEHLIAEVNGTIIARGQWAATILTPESRVELVTFVGGG